MLRKELVTHVSKEGFGALLDTLRMHKLILMIKPRKGGLEVSIDSRGRRLLQASKNSDSVEQHTQVLRSEAEDEPSVDPIAHAVDTFLDTRKFPKQLRVDLQTSLYSILSEAASIYGAVESEYTDILRSEFDDALKSASGSAVDLSRKEKQKRWNEARY